MVYRDVDDLVVEQVAVHALFLKYMPQSTLYAILSNSSHIAAILTAVILFLTRFRLLAPSQNDRT